MSVVVHSLPYMLVTFSVFHDAMGPCVPSPWPEGTSMSAYVVHVPLPVCHALPGFQQYEYSVPALVRLRPHSPMH